MAVGTLPSTLSGAVTPVCGECGVWLFWDITLEEYEALQPFWDAWICEDCNGGVPFTPESKRPMPPLLLQRS